MLPILVTILFIGGALLASAFAHDEKRWRYPFLAAAACAGFLTIWGAGALRRMLQHFDTELSPLLATIVAALPFCWVLGNLVVRRRDTPRHTPSLNDDPTLRRHVEEKRRRARKRRQEEEAIENSDLPSN
jgi:hypothetical protein